MELQEEILTREIEFDGSQHVLGKIACGNPTREDVMKVFPLDHRNAKRIADGLFRDGFHGVVEHLVAVVPNHIGTRSSCKPYHPLRNLLGYFSIIEYVNMPKRLL